jgi:signal peptidase I
VRANGFLTGSRCPKCVQSKIEYFIENYFIRNNIKYKTQYKIRNCKDKRPLPFDFAVFKEKKLILLLEADGKQHFEKVYFGGISEEEATKNFNYVRWHDEIKNNFCKQNNINLIRIPYWDFNEIDIVLQDKLKYCI